MAADRAQPLPVRAISHLKTNFLMGLMGVLTGLGGAWTHVTQGTLNKSRLFSSSQPGRDGVALQLGPVSCNVSFYTTY